MSKVNTEQELEIKCAYAELKGMLSQAPKPGEILYDDKKTLWDRFNSLAESIFNITKDQNIQNMRLEPRNFDGNLSIQSDIYRSGISSLISRLHAAYFSNEPEPFGASQTPMFSQTNNQTVSMHLIFQLGIDLKSASDKASSENEKTFFKRLLEQANTTAPYVEFLLLVGRLASEHKISWTRIIELFS